MADGGAVNNSHEHRTLKKTLSRTCAHPYRVDNLFKHI
jgi:hypothetical protein